MPPEVDPHFERLLDYVRDGRGFDFTGYKRASLMRRVRKRMQVVGIEGFSQYQDYLEVHPDEFTELFNTILINVTSFFRDADSWEFLANEILPQIVERKGPDEPIRIWSVGCASGEEAYTVAMLVAKDVGLANMLERVKIYATDVDDDALAQARSGIYDTKAVQAIPSELRERYLEPANGAFALKKELRRAVIFGRHDLVKDAPISRVDLAVCRNTLMYFNAETQSRIYNGLHFALAPAGYLFLGKSEMLLTRTSMFAPVDVKRRLFARVPMAGEHVHHAPPPITHAQDSDEQLRRAVFESATVAQIVLGASGSLVSANSLARSEFGVADADLGRPFRELELSYRPIELRSRIDSARTELRPNIEPAVAWESRTGVRRYLDVEVIPLLDHGEPLGTSITFTDVSGAHELRSQLERSRRELETAYEEIQSTVEELETTNEELQSTNEELETINTELTDRTGQLNLANVFLESILGSMRAGVIVLDRDLSVQSWNHLAEDMWGLRADEARAKNLFALDFGLPVDQLRKPIRDTLAPGAEPFLELTLDAVNRRGKAIRCKVLVSPMRDGDGNGHGVILLVEEVESESRHLRKG